MSRVSLLPLHAALAALALAAAAPVHGALSIGNNPLFLVVGKANVLITLDNSNSMDEAPNGSAIGSNNAASKSEIARTVIRNLTDVYRSRVNMGLMAYRLNSPSSYALHNSPYDVSFNPLNYNPAFTGARASTTKRFRAANPSSATDYIYYNVALPFYAGSSQGNAFCYSSTANASNDFNSSGSLTGPWDDYRCFSTKTGPSDALPTNGTTETANGWSGNFYNGQLSPTDSDYAQGILDFGRFLTWNYVGPTWFRNDSPGRGYLHIPLGDLTATQATNIKAKLACNVPGNPSPCTSSGIQNAGLTPIEGTLLTARDYYKGTWNVSNEGYTSGCYPLPTSCGKNFVVLLTDGLPSTNKNGAALSNPTQALTEAAAAAAALKADGIETYIIGFALPYGTNPNTLDQIAVAGGTDKAYYADNQASLQAAFDDIFTDVFKKSSAFGSVAQNSTSINTGSRVYQGRFDSTDWSGEIVALRPESNGTLTSLWSSSDAGQFAAPSARKVYTLKPGTGGVEFKTLTDLATTQQTALATTNCSTTLIGALCAQARIDWLRGDRSKEDNPLRRRSKIMGDVIDSSPYYVKSTDTLYVGANDGMLHAFNATTGAELFAFVPNAVIANLYQLTSTSYTHNYYVDGDIAVSTAAETSGRNILVGSLGRGGKALYALDVSNPSGFDASKVMWEFTDPDLGLVLGRPVIAKLNNGQTAVIVGNGYNSTNERSVLFVINILDGTLIRKIDTQPGVNGSNNGMSSPRGWDNDGSGTVDLLYAGDLLGNLWKFDLSSTTASAWATAYTASGAPAPMFVATTSGGTRQPITGMPGLAIDLRRGDANYGKRFVFIGSGRYITTGDVTDTSTQSWYGVVDDDATAVARSELKTRSIVLEGTIGTTSSRAFSSATAGDMAGKRGWVIDMVSPTLGNLGERFIGEHKVFGDLLIATSIIPSSDACIPGGQGYINAIDPFSGASLSTLFFDPNNDLVFNDSDRLGTAKLVVGSINPGNNLTSDPIIIGNRIITSGTGTGGGAGSNASCTGSSCSNSISKVARSGRITWREVISK